MAGVLAGVAYLIAEIGLFNSNENLNLLFLKVYAYFKTTVGLLLLVSTVFLIYGIATISKYSKK